MLQTLQLCLKNKVNLLALLFVLPMALTAQTTYYVNDNATTGDVLTSAIGNDANTGTAAAPFATIAHAISIATTNDIIRVDAGTYAENVNVNKSVTINGADSATTILNRGDANYVAGNSGGDGFTVSANNVTINKFKIKNFNAGITNTSGVNNLSISLVSFIENYGTGFYTSLTLSNLSITNSTFYFNGYKNSVASSSPFRRGIMLQGAGDYSNLIFTGNNFLSNGLVGLDISSSNSLSGLTITNNIVRDNLDAQLSIWLGTTTPTSNAVLISNNILTLTGNARYGIEIKNSNGNGKSSGVGSVVVSNNTISVGAGHTGNARDIAAIAIIRRKDGSTTINDQPQGVYVSGNTINDFQNGLAGDAFGIAVGGTGHTITSNTITNTEFSIQLQKGNDSTGALGNSEQNNTDAYFSRDNSKDVCAELISNTITTSGAPRLVTGTATTSLTLPTIKTANATLGTTFCTLQQAIDFTATTTGNNITAQAGTYDELVVINKSVTLDGLDSSSRIVAYTGTVPSTSIKSLFAINVQNVTVKNFQFKVDFVKVHSAIATSGDVSNLTVTGNYIKAAYPGIGTLLGYGTRNAININQFGTTNAINANLIQNVTIQSNTIDSIAGVNGIVFRAGVTVDRVTNLIVGGNSASNGNNFITSINHDIITRFYHGDQTIKNNNLKGGGIEISAPQSTGTATINDNTFNGAWSKINAWAMLRISLNPYSTRNINVGNNNFIDQKWAISAEDAKNVMIDNNDFTATVDKFRLVSINTKMRTNSGSPSPLDTISVKLTNNDFNAVGSFTAGNALEFLNFDQQAPLNAYLQGTYTIGTLGNENNFNTNIPTFIAISNSDGVLTSNATFQLTYPEYAGSQATTTGYWKKNIDARNNRFFTNGSLKLATSFNASDYTAISTSIFDKSDDVNIGAVILATPSWTGATSTDWSTPTNWSVGIVPTTGLDAVIATAVNQPTLTATSTCDSLILNTGTTLTTAANTLNVFGNIKNSGTINGATGTIVIAGTTAQTITGGLSASNLAVNNATGATITGGIVNVTGTYTPTTGALITNGLLTLKSSLAGTARVATGAGTITGNVTVERFIDGGKRAWRFLAHPFSTAVALSNYADDVDITGAGGTSNGFATDASLAPSAYSYNTITGNGSIINDIGWTGFSTTSQSIASGDGFRLFVRGSKGQSGIYASPYPVPGAVTISTTGTLNPSGDYTKNLVLGSAGYNFVGNPYASAVDVTAITRTGSVNTNTWVWNAHLGTTGGYLTYAANAGYAVPSGGSFFVQATAAAQSITFTEANKTTTDSSTMLRHSNVKGLVEISITSNNALFDRYVLMFDKKGNNTYDNILDAKKFKNAEANLYSLSADGQALAVDVRSYNADMIIPVGFTSNTVRTYTFSIDKLNVDAGNELYLRDKFLNTETLLTAGTTYEFNTTTDAASQGESRFQLVTKTSKPKMLATDMMVLVYPNPIKDVMNIKLEGLNEKENTTLQVINIEGKIIKTIELGKVATINETINAKAFATGNYSVQIVNGNKLVTKKVVKL